MKRGGVILCGGESTRMGIAKETLPFGPETMLARIVRILGEACEPIVVVAAREQTLPELPAAVIVTRDRQPNRGPLAGISAGLAALPSDVTAAYVTACDVPLLEPALVRHLFSLLQDHAAVVPVSGGHVHPLAAVYRTSLIDLIDHLLESGPFGPAALFDRIDTRRVEERELRAVDPTLATLQNLNHPRDYLAALTSAGFAAPPEIEARLANATPTEDDKN
jgi:molybdenum cofactor guanylyltransferase